MNTDNAVPIFEPSEATIVARSHVLELARIVHRLGAGGRFTHHRDWITVEYLPAKPDRWRQDFEPEFYRVTVYDSPDPFDDSRNATVVLDRDVFRLGDWIHLLVAEYWRLKNIEREAEEAKAEEERKKQADRARGYEPIAGGTLWLDAARDMREETGYTADDEVMRAVKYALKTEGVADADFLRCEPEPAAEPAKPIQFPLLDPSDSRIVDTETVRAAFDVRGREPDGLLLNSVYYNDGPVDVGPPDNTPVVLRFDGFETHEGIGGRLGRRFYIETPSGWKSTAEEFAY